MIEGLFKEEEEIISRDHKLDDSEKQYCMAFPTLNKLNYMIT